ncbi:MAG TPA: 4-coumarate--CoA ligase family protein [Chloroflexota bacterium]|nr:4-coumarate--CoA ligase family protein [Chloroflexota bacterium]
MIHQSPFPPITIPDISLPRLLLDAARGREDRIAIIEGASGRSITYGEFTSQVRRVAANLAQRGLLKGDVFAIFLPNSIEYAIALQAVMLLGGIATTVNPTYTAHELAFQLEDANAVYLLTIPPLLERAREANRAGLLREIFVVGEADGATPFHDLLAESGEPPDVVIDALQDLAILPYSSGTTGLPKGVMLTHHNLVANILQIRAAEPRLDEETRLLAVLPFYHIYGQVVVLYLSLYVGGTIVTMPRFDLPAFLQVIQNHKVSYANLVPPIILALAKHPLVDQYDLSSLKAVFSGAAPLGDEVAAACAARLGCVVKQGYGLTETSPVTHVMPESDGPMNTGSIGVCLPLTETRLVDPETGNDLGPNQRGEVWVRGPQVMRGYLNRPDATAAMLDSAGWLRTGDIGYVDDTGYFYIVDRLKELIKYKGLQIAPAELEAILLTHPAVADAAVIPCPDQEAGEIPKAFVVLKGEATAEELQAYVAEKVAPYKKIRRLEFCAQIPKSASGKILRRVLVEQERAAAAGGPST